MQPISALPVLEACALGGVCFDIDDTVTTHGVLDPEAYAALHALRSAGLKLIAVTGRPLGFAEIVARTWMVDAAVGENGAGYIAREPEGFRHGFWDDEATRVAQAKRLAEIRARVLREMPHVRVTSDNWARRCDLAFDANEHARLPEHDIAQLSQILESEGAHVTVSSVHVHAQLGNHDKATGVARAADELWSYQERELRERFAFVGDSGNDRAAFAWFRVTAGVANVIRHLQRLPEPPRFVASREYGAGFAEIARTILLKRSARA